MSAINYTIGEAREWAALPAAGAYDAAPMEFPIQSFSELSFGIRYRAALAGGAVTYTVEFSSDRVIWYRVAEVHSVTPVPGADVVDLTQRAEFSYMAVGIDPESFMTPSFTTPMAWARILFKETGQIGSPGSVSCEYLLRGGI